jgi:hypothetical protein
MSGVVQVWRLYPALLALRDRQVRPGTRVELSSRVCVSACLRHHAPWDANADAAVTICRRNAVPETEHARVIPRGLPLSAGHAPLSELQVRTVLRALNVHSNSIIARALRSLPWRGSSSRVYVYVCVSRRASESLSVPFYQHHKPLLPAEAITAQELAGWSAHTDAVVSLQVPPSLQCRILDPTPVRSRRCCFLNTASVSCTDCRAGRA